MEVCIGVPLFAEIPHGVGTHYSRPYNPKKECREVLGEQNVLRSFRHI